MVYICILSLFESLLGYVFVHKDNGITEVKCDQARLVPRSEMAGRIYLPQYHRWLEYYLVIISSM